MKREYVILVIGAILFFIGIVLAIIYGINIATSFVVDNIILNGSIIEPSSSINRTLQITNNERPLSIALYIESEYGNVLQQNNSQIMAEIINPIGKIVNRNELDDREEDGLFTTFMPETYGDYTIRISNNGTEPVNIGGMIGYLPLTQSNQLDIQPIYGIIIGIVLFSLGIVTLIAGGLIAIVDRRKKSAR